ncbi:YmaF family protein [Paenibacillus tarimensis]
MRMKEQNRLAPPHSHYIEVQTSLSGNHSHWIRAFGFPVNGSSTDGHFHTFKGVTSTGIGHVHQFEGITGPPIPVSDGSHYHAIFGITNEQPFIHQGNQMVLASYPRHGHEYKGATGIEIG